MTPRDVFGIIVRSTGLLMMPAWMFLFTASLISWNAQGVIFAMLWSLAALYMLKGAPVLLEYSYPTGARKISDSGALPLAGQPTD